MPFWHDPFDELIAALERVTPSPPAPIDDIPPVERIQLVICRLLYGDAHAQMRAEHERVTKEVEAYFERLAAQRRPISSPPPQRRRGPSAGLPAVGRRSGRSTRCLVRPV